MSNAIQTNWDLCGALCLSGSEQWAEEQQYRLELLIGRVIDSTESLNQLSHSFSVGNNTDYLFSVGGDQLYKHV